MKVPYQLSDYKGVALRGNYALVDKTKYIEVLEDVGFQLLFLRPRRFGKSFFLSMLQCYYDIREKENFEKLFWGTYIYDHKTAYANSYHVLKFDFSSVSDDRENVKSTFCNIVRKIMLTFAKTAGLPITPIDTGEPNALLADFLEQYRAMETGIKLYLMIDEYDNFANEFLSKDKPYFDSIFQPDMINKTQETEAAESTQVSEAHFGVSTSSVESSWLKNFYKVIKAYSGNTIERIYITGVTPITIDAVTSGATNISRIGDLSLLNEMLGFTDDELKDYLGRLGISCDDYYPIFKAYYDGYSFFGDRTVFNTNITLRTLDRILLTQKLPRNLVDMSILTDPEKLAGLFRLCDSHETAIRLIEDIMGDGEVAGYFQSDFHLQNGFTRDAMISMLYYLGVLSIKGEGELDKYVFQLPNESMRVIFNEFYIHMNAGKYDRGTYSDIQEALTDRHDIQPLLDELNKMLEVNSNRDARYFNESNLKTMLSAILYNNPSYALKSELEFNGGYADVAVLPDHVHHLNHYYLFELKYLPAGEAGGKSIPAGEAGGKVVSVGEAGGKVTQAGEALGKVIPAEKSGDKAIQVGEAGDTGIPMEESFGKAIPADGAGERATPSDGAGETAIEAKLREARGQLQRYMKDPLVSKLANLHKYIIVASLRGVLKVEEMKA